MRPNCPKYTNDICKTAILLQGDDSAQMYGKAFLYGYCYQDYFLILLGKGHT